MKSTLRLLGLLLAGAAFGPPRLAQAQTPTLEFAAGASNANLNPTGNGPSVANQVITFQNNANNPNDNVFTTYTPTITATFSLSNQQYSNVTGGGTGTGESFGTTTNGSAATATALFPLMSAVGGSNNGNYTSASTITAGSGIAIASNRSLWLFTAAQALPTNASTTGRYQYADLTITFSQAVNNPVIHVTGLGGTTGSLGFSSELDLLTSDVSLSKLSGSTELNVTSTQILNSATTLAATTGSGAASGSVLVTTARPVTTLQFRIYLRGDGGGTAWSSNNYPGDAWLISTSALSSPSLSGIVFEDVNYGGGAGRPSTASGAVVRPGATVELYSGNTFVGTTTTDANGKYTFNVANGTYTVRVVNRTVTSSRTGATASLLPVQTYNGTTTRVGGENPSFTDAAANTGSQTLSALSSGQLTPESIATITTSGLAATGPDFGYNFDTVVNTNDSGQGSLRQFVANANALGGEANLAQSGSRVDATGTTQPLPAGRETSIFMIPDGAAHPGLLASSNGGPASQLTGGVAVITTASTLTLSGTNAAGTIIDGTTQTANIGNTNSGTATNASARTVGTDALTLTALQKPEVELVGTNILSVLDLEAATNTVRGLAVHGSVPTNGTNAQDILVGGSTASTGYVLENLLIGTAADGTRPGSNTTGNYGIYLSTNAGVGTIQNSLVGFTGNAGIDIANGTGTAGTTQILSNFFVKNGYTFPGGDGITLGDKGVAGPANIAGNSFSFTNSSGVQFEIGSTSASTVTNNTIDNAGNLNDTGATTSNLEGSAIDYLQRDGSKRGTQADVISKNVITNTQASGIVIGYGQQNVTISQNSIYNSSTGGGSKIGIDLIGSNKSVSTGDGVYGVGDGVTLNDGNAPASATGELANRGVDFPVITSAVVSGTSLVVSGYSRPGAVIELFNTGSPANTTNFGEGQTYLGTFTEGNATDDADTGTGSYSGVQPNGLNQGSDNAANRFRFTLLLANLTAAQRAVLLSGNAILSSTATLNNSTSEFSGNVALPITDVTTALTGPQTLTPGQPSGTYTASFTNEGPVTASTVTRTVTLPAGATNIIVNGAAYTPTTANTIDFGTAATLASGASNSFTFSFTPATTATGSLAITSNISTTTSQGINTAPDASTITAPVIPLANVATTLTTSTPSIAAGSSATGRFQVTFSNGGPSVADGVVASVQLPTGLTNVSATNNSNGVYSPTTGILTYPDVTSITNGGVVNSTITFDAPASGPVVASSAISTTTNEAGQTANNTATAAVTINPAFDLTTTLTGPTTNVAGNLVTLAVTTTNNGPSPAPNAVQTVQLTTGLTNVYVSNGGVYNALTTTQSITSNGVTYSVPAGGVVFPTVASLPSGQTVANSISFAMPTTTGFAPTALVTPNTTGAGETNTANNTAALNNVSGTNLTNVNSQAGISNAYTTISTSTASTTVGSAVTLTVVTGNNGPARATGVTQTVQILPGFTTATLQVNGITGTAGTNSITFGTNGPVYNTLTGLVTFPTLTDGANGSASATSVSNTITFTPSAATSTTVATTGSNGQILAMAAVRTTNTDPVPADNVSSVAVTLAQSADLATTITGPATVQPGQAVTYTATFVNNGSMTANGVTETAQLPAGLGTNGVTITDGTGNAVSGASYNSTTGLVTFPALTTDASGARQVFKLTFTAPNQGFTALSNISSVTPDAVATNNSAAAPTAVAAAADLATVVSGPATAVVGNPVTYTVTTTNNGPVTATNATTTLQLAANFSATTLQVNGTTGTASGNTITYNLTGGATATYTISTGLVTFPVVAGLPNGASASNYVTFVMPSPASGQTSGIASVSALGVDPVSGNNTASVATSVAPTTTTSADLVATVSASATTVAPGATVTYTASYSNIGTDAATNVVPTLQLLPGLTTATIPLVSGGTGTANGNIITFSNGTTYNSTTGVVSFPPIASQATGTSGNVSYTVQVVMPNNGPVLATAATTSNTSEPNTTAAQANNVQSAPVTITPSFNEVTSISGPAPTTAGTSSPTTALAGTSQTYTVTATNNGPSATSNATTQTVTVPAGQTPTNITNNGVYSSTNNNITWTIPAGQGPGGSNAVTNSFTIVQPTTSITLTATVAVTGESKTDDNTASITTTPLNLAPLAYAVVNSLQNPQSNEAGGLATGLLISPLNASDPEGAFATQKYTIVAAPDASQGTLYYSSNGTTTGTYTQVPVNPTQPLTLTQAQAQTLRFKAATGFVGNASFTYLTTDAAGNLSPAANYTIPVETDVDAVAYTITPTKGGSGSPTPYVAGDVIAFTTDANGAVYNASTSSVYTTTGTLQAGANNGIVAASAVAGSFTSSRTGVTSLADIGLVIDATGRIVVDVAPNTSKLKSGNYSVQILTTDGNGGQTTRTVSFNIPGNPLPVVLTAFTASAVQNRDAQLGWITASEVNSAYFDVERSFDGTTFTKVGQVAAQGTTAASTTYAFTDKGVASLTAGAVYYRLRQVDLDAKSSYSPVRTVSFTKATVATLSLYPNPAQSATSLDLSQLPASASYQVLLLDATGRQVRSATVAGGQVQPLNLTDLATGTYHVLVTGTQADGSALRQTLRLTKD